MAYKKHSLEWMEETICDCGCGHGSGEAHAPECTWLKVERHTLLAKAAAEFAVTPGLHKVRVDGKMMTRKQVATELAPPVKSRAARSRSFAAMANC